MSLEPLVVDAAGGVFTEGFTQEFQLISDVGEDIILACENKDFGANSELEEFKSTKICHKCGGKLQIVKSIELGHIFTLGTKYSQKMGVYFQDESGKKQDLWFASYGIGVSRLLGVLVEQFHDERGIIWPESVAPFKVHLIGLDLEDEKILKEAEKIYKLLEAEGIEVLLDDRINISAGEKFADCDLIGVPIRVVISKRTHSATSGQAEGKLEVKKRNEKETEFMNLEELFRKIK